MSVGPNNVLPGSPPAPPRPRRALLLQREGPDHGHLLLGGGHGGDDDEEEAGNGEGGGGLPPLPPVRAAPPVPVLRRVTSSYVNSPSTSLTSTSSSEEVDADAIAADLGRRLGLSRPPPLSDPPPLRLPPSFLSGRPGSSASSPSAVVFYPSPSDSYLRELVRASSGEDLRVVRAALASATYLLSAMLSVVYAVARDLLACTVSTDHLGLAVGLGPWCLPVPPGVGGGNTFVACLSEFADYSIDFYDDLCLYVSALSSLEPVFDAVRSGRVDAEFLFGSPFDRGLYPGVFLPPPVPPVVDLIPVPDASSLDRCEDRLRSSSVFSGDPSHPLFRVLQRVREFYAPNPALVDVLAGGGGGGGGVDDGKENVDLSAWDVPPGLLFGRGDGGGGGEAVASPSVRW